MQDEEMQVERAVVRRAALRRAEPEEKDEEMPRQLGDPYKDWEGRRVSVARYKVLSESRAKT